MKSVSDESPKRYIQLDFEELRLLLREESELAARKAVDMALGELGLDGLTKDQISQIKSIADFVSSVKRESIKTFAGFVTKGILVLIVLGLTIKFKLLGFFYDA